MEGVMRQTKAEIYLHLVWATWRRAPYLSRDIEQPVYRCIGREVARLHCRLIAIGGMPDHVHLCVRMATTVSVARLMNQVKGVSSHFIHAQLSGQSHFAWQDGYAAFSIGPNQIARVKQYVVHQKRHHLDKTLHALWEETDQPYAAHPPASNRQ